MDFNALYLRCKFWICDFFKGSPIGKPYKDVKYIQEHSCEVGSHLREQALQRLLLHAKKNSFFYSNQQELELSSFPVVNKITLIENYDTIKVDESLIPFQKGPVHIQTTSGSTGVPLKIPQDSNKRNRRVAELKYFGKVVGFKTHEKLIHLRTWNKWQQKTSKQIKSDNIIPFDIACMSDDNLKKLCELTVASNAVCLRGYASSLGKMAEYADGKGFSFPNLKVAIAGSEALLDETRSLFKKVMKCEIISQYANEECGILAQEKVPTRNGDNNMYFNYASYYLEVLKMDSNQPADYGEVGRIVITDLYNYAFPIIRYDTGDVGMLSEPDQFSYGYPVLKKLYGRRFDLTYTTKGDAVYPLTYGRILKNFSDMILQWQFIQKGQKDYELKVIERKQGCDFSVIIELLKDHLGTDANIAVSLVVDIPVLNSGKRKPVVNEWN